MKKYLSVLLLSLLITSCGGGEEKVSIPDEVDPPSIDTTFDYTISPNLDEDGNYIIDIYGLNDFHGSITTSDDLEEPGLIKLGTYFKEKYLQNPGGTILVSTGDMWQGSADSNITKGQMLTVMMNQLNFEAMALGNHEFDWSDELIYENAKIANFPFLGANIIDKRTNERADFADGSTLVTRGDFTLGIIGTIGSELERSIMPSYVENYEFIDPLDSVNEEALKLKAAGAQAIILLDHDGWVSPSFTQREIINSGHIDAVFSGHTHTLDNQMIEAVPVVQSTGYGREIMYVQLKVAKDSGVVSAFGDVIDSKTYVSGLADDEDIKYIFDYYNEQLIAPVKDEVVGSLRKDMNEDALTNMATKSILEAAKKIDSEVVAAAHNFGGIRVDSLPKGQITYGDIYKAVPFDNTIAVFELTGAQILSIRSGNRIILEEGLKLDNNTKYKIALISYIYEYNRLPVELALFVMELYTRDYLADLFRSKKNINPDEYAHGNINMV